MSTAASVVAAILFVLVMVFAGSFCFCLACGAPWGEYYLGGKYPGKVPPLIRALCIAIQVPQYVFMALVVLARSGVAFPALDSPWIIWVLVGVMGLSLVMNLISSSKWDRIVWAPQTALCLVASLAIALDA